ncbi:DJ-1/PfpI family protein [Leptospira sp. 201903075]|uniref:DJ-1/PfpI family protein n=1 Tax=Leptospira chreensis TaxID=2810035 RepID=UPI001963EDB3|nr:DJ-1/PfpI family protein [Leptospira chreensis]MBM9591111.1 DJ-1/PfpI family protein [Leptospira chreensis]
MNQNLPNIQKKKHPSPTKYMIPPIGLVILLTLVFHTVSVLSEPKVPNQGHLEKIPKKQNHKKPVIVVIGENQYTELTDFIVPYGILKRSDIAEIYAVAPNKGTMNMFPALSIEITTSIDDFDKLHPEGSDLVIVPAIHNAENKTIIQWIQNQSKNGATIVGICDGVWTLGHAGLLNHKKATGHWYSKEDLMNKFPNTEWEKNKRYIQDQNIITTTGVTASIPISLALIESLAGTKKAKEIANELGIQNWNPTHNTEEFDLDWKQYLTAAKNLTFVWNYETIGIPLYDGIDEISLALVADSYSRTYKSKTKSIASSNQPILSKSGILFLPEIKEENRNETNVVVEVTKAKKAGPALEETLKDIQKRYGTGTMRFVATQLEFSTHELCHYVTCKD